MSLSKRLILIAAIVLLSLAIVLPISKPYPLSSFTLKKGLDLQGGTRLLYEADVANLPVEDRQNALDSAKKIIESRVNFFGVSEPVIQTLTARDSYRLSVELPGISDINQAVSLIGLTAQLDFRKYKETTDSGEIELPTLENTVSTGVTGKDMRRFQLSFNPQDGTPTVSFETTDEGKEKFAAVTRELLGLPLIAFLDNQVISVATVQSEIIGSGQITGQFTTKEAKTLVSLFNAGSLPVPLELIEQRNVAATLGQDSVSESTRAGLIGLALVAAFMIVYYRKQGVIATVSLLIYALISLAAYMLLKVTITLPGVAGFLLSVGMAVDSNILIFERMKDEIKAGRPQSQAMELGFGRAWDSIRDANIATIITTFILFNPLNWDFLNISGPIRGFALTLFLGIIIGLFTGIFVTRTLMRIFLKAK